MKVEKIEYNNFRNIERAVIEPCGSVNVLFGANAQGKTNALEGIYLFARGKGFRATKEKEIIKFGEKYAGVKMTFERNGERRCDLEMFFDDTGKKVCRKNKINIRKMSEFIGNFRAVLFCPQHLGLVKDGPAVRRGFLDEAISQISSGYLAALQRYYDILAQRNALIKNSAFDRSVLDATIGIWSEQLAQEAEYIARARAEYIEKLNSQAQLLFKNMTSDRERPEIVYNGCLTKAQFLAQLTENIERECRYGYTCYGTHRDDFEVLLNGREARIYASQGQQRSIALSLKLAEGDISKEMTGEYPVFLFDDVLSELDSERQSFIMSKMSGRQVFITSCAPETVSASKKLIEDMGDSGSELAVFKVSSGGYEKIKV